VAIKIVTIGRTSQLTLFFFITLLFLFCACRGGIAAASPKTEIKAIFRTTPTENAVTSCSIEETQRFREQTTGAPGKRALKVCEREARLPENQTTSDIVSHIRVSGWTATAHLRELGDNLEGQILKIRFIRVGGRWKADEILGFFHLDRDKLIDAFKEVFSSPGNYVPAKFAACIYGRLRHASGEEITEYLFSGSREAIHELYDRCLSEHPSGSAIAATPR
jgi:hypothetical protein